MKEPNVKLWMRQNIFDNQKKLQEIIVGQGILLVSALAIVALFMAIGLLYLITKKQFLMNIIKEKLMWSSVFRGSI